MAILHKFRTGIDIVINGLVAQVKGSKATVQVSYDDSSTNDATLNCQFGKWVKSKWVLYSVDPIRVERGDKEEFENMILPQGTNTYEIRCSNQQGERVRTTLEVTVGAITPQEREKEVDEQADAIRTRCDMKEPQCRMQVCGKLKNINSGNARMEQYMEKWCSNDNDLKGLESACSKEDKSDETGGLCTKTLETVGTALLKKIKAGLTNSTTKEKIMDMIKENIGKVKNFINALEANIKQKPTEKTNDKAEDVNKRITIQNTKTVISQQTPDNIRESYKKNFDSIN